MKVSKSENNASPARVTNVQGLMENGLAAESQRSMLEKTAAAFSIGLSPHLMEKMKSPNAEALKKQYLPAEEELKTTPGEYEDPIGDKANSPVKGIVHRYPDRALLKAVNVCAVYCRFCFRRELIGPESETLSEFELEQALKYIRETPKIWEVILTGGDPLILSPARLEKILRKLDSIEHVRTVRIHTRIPVADPDRVTPALLSALASCTKTLYMALHINHPEELSPEVEKTIKNLQNTGCALLAQSVFLRGVNDNAETLACLYRRLIELRVKPYELHHPDKAKGTSHFRIPLEKGREIYEQLRGHLSGLCIPHYLLDIPGGHGKIEVNTSNVLKLEDGLHQLRDFKGNTHLYRDE